MGCRKKVDNQINSRGRSSEKLAGVPGRFGNTRLGTFRWAGEWSREPITAQVQTANPTAAHVNKWSKFGVADSGTLGRA